MARRITGGILALVMAGLLAATGSAWAQAPIGPGQNFSGVVNGATAKATVRVLCPGPVGPTSRGRPAAAQSWEVRPGGSGFTGSAGTRVVATFEQDASAPVTFTAYRVSEPASHGEATVSPRQRGAGAMGGATA